MSTLGEIGNYHNGRAFKKSEWSPTGRPIIRIQNLTGSSKSFNYFEGHAEERHVAHSGDLLISWAATLGAYVWGGPEAVINQHIFKVESKIDPAFHKYLLDHKLDELKSLTRGSGMVHITRKDFNSILIAIPPAEEQHRIIAHIEEHIASIESASSTLVADQLRIEALRRMLIRGAITGHAFSEERKPWGLPDVGLYDGVLPDIPQSWFPARLGDVADVMGGVTKDAKKESEPGYVARPYLRVANVQRGRLVLDNVTEIKVSAVKAEQLELRPGDVLLNEGGDRDKLARGWVWEGQVPKCIHQNHVFRARVHEGVMDPYFLSFLADTIGGAWAERNGKQSVNLASISLSKIKQMPVVVPPFEESQRIARELMDQLNELNRLDQALASALRRADSLRRSILTAAFEGRLTEQQPRSVVVAPDAHSLDQLALPLESSLT